MDKKIILIAIVGLSAFFFVGAASPEYRVTTDIKGYVSKTDPTQTAPDYLVAGSQNVVINDQDKVETRSGYELFGAASTTANPVKSEFVWKDSTGGEILLRESGGVLQFLPVATSTDSRGFENLLGGLNPNATSTVRFATVWSQKEQLDVLLFVNHASSTLFEWSGGQGTFSSDTSSTVVINEGIASSTPNRFLSNGTRQIRIKDSNGTWQTFNYTGQSGNTFSGVTPDPTAFSFATNALVVQAVRWNTNTPSSNFVNDTIKTLNNQVWIGSASSRAIYVSKDTSYTDFSYSAPRVAGEGAFITLDGETVGMESPDDQKMIVFSGNDRVYQISFEVSPGQTSDREVPRVKPLLISEGQGAQSQELIGKIKQALVWVSNNNELVELGQVENLPSPQAVAISDPIKPDFTKAVFTNGDVSFWENDIFITAPSDGKMFIFDVSKRFWQPPQIMAVRRLSVYGGKLLGHSNAVPETYTLFTGTNDNGNPISFKAHFAYQNGGRREALKNFDRFFTELYLTSNTTVTVNLLYEWKGAKQIQTFELNGSDSTFQFNPSADASLGVSSLGTNPLGSLLDTDENTPKYRRFKQIVPTDYFEYQPRFETDSIDASFQLVAFGANERLSANAPAKITK